MDCIVSEKKDVFLEIEWEKIQMNLNTFLWLTMLTLHNAYNPEWKYFLKNKSLHFVRYNDRIIRNILIVAAGNQSFIFTLAVKIATSFHLIQLHRCKSYGYSVTFFIQIETILSFWATNTCSVLFIHSECYRPL